MSGFALDGWGLIGALLIVGALGLLTGAALGYFTASTDLQRERAKAWDQGSSAMQHAIAKVWQPPTTLIARVRNPYGRGLAPAPPHVVIPTPRVGPSDATLRLRADSLSLFDQDAPTAAARAIELRGDG